VERELRFPRSIAFDRDYWLCRCEGFRVESPEGRVGVVEEVRFESRHDRPDVIVVRGGLFGARQFLVPVADVADVVPREEKLVLRPQSAPAPDLAQTLQRRLRTRLRRA
jgi:hypothetical protein